MQAHLPPIALTIAGSDSGGGAGIQGDLKTFQARQVHGLTVITAVTAQNTRGVSAVHNVPQQHVQNQLDAVFDDFPVAAVKTGMLGRAGMVRLVARELCKRCSGWLVVDPVMIATSGARLLEEDAIEALRHALIPLANVLTPNAPEAEALLNRRLRKAQDFERAGADLRAMGAEAVLLKGAHVRGDLVIDRYFDARGTLELRHPRQDREGHGTGCTLAAAITAELARGLPPRTAVRRAVAYVQRALTHGYRPGQGTPYVLRH